MSKETPSWNGKNILKIKSDYYLLREIEELKVYLNVLEN
jgi:hypothetical protein